MRFPRGLNSLLLASALVSALPAQAQAPRAGNAIVVAEMVEPLMAKWKDAYRSKHPGWDLSYASTLQDSVFKAFLAGQSLLAPSARDFTREEIAAFTAKWGYAPTRVAICMDGLVVLVHKSNPLKEIKIEQLDAIYSTTRLQGWPKDIQVWGDLGLTTGNWATRPIEVLGHPVGSGTRMFYLSAVQKNGTSKPTIQRGADILEMVENLTANQAAIGYGSMSQNYSSLRTVPVVPAGGKTAIEANPANIVEGAYPLGRILYTYVNQAPGKPLNANLLNFLRYILSKDGQSQVTSAGFVPLAEDIAGINLRRLEAAR
ncbi:PstS family phosphate ABC transporter substrate-binding protein [Mesoterricola silvestris]|uniref:Phosphate-binding protein PstS n=1 Tax=Mesoterricola silvestris TaxID=2927979 RepID=A0AA48GXB0_9BACT|nr:substrate-binding domain-containing protein [Mesoterricola silvestris]BDU72058.1 phosphate-binding protein PstS [Mesoterricola silvestris]